MSVISNSLTAAVNETSGEDNITAVLVSQADLRPEAESIRRRPAPSGGKCDMVGGELNMLLENSNSKPGLKNVQKLTDF